MIPAAALRLPAALPHWCRVARLTWERWQHEHQIHKQLSSAVYVIVALAEFVHWRLSHQERMSCCVSRMLQASHKW